MELDPYFREYVKIKPMGEDLNNVRAKTIKHLKQKSKSGWPWIWQWLLRYNTKDTSNKRKTDKLDFSKIKNFLLQRTQSRK